MKYSSPTTARHELRTLESPGVDAEHLFPMAIPSSPSQEEVSLTLSSTQGTHSSHAKHPYHP